MNRKKGCIYYKGISLSDAKEQTTDASNKMDETQKHAEWGKPDQNTIYYITPLYKSLENTNKVIVTESRSIVACRQRWRKRWTIKAYEQNFGGDGYAVHLDCGSGFMGGYVCESSFILQFRWIRLLVAKLSLNKADF